MMNLPPRNQQLIIGPALIAIVLFGYLVMLRPSVAVKISKNHKKISSLKKDIEKIKKQADGDKLASAKTKLETQNKELARLQTRLLPRQALLKYLDQLTALVKENAIGLEFIQLKQLPFRREEKDIGGTKKVNAETFPVEIRLRGNCLEFASYIWLLEKMPQVIRVEKINITRNRGSQLDIIVTVAIPAGLVKEEKAG